MIYEETAEKIRDGKLENELQSNGKRDIRKPVYLNDYVLFSEYNCPESHSSAMKSDEAKEWGKVMDDEMASLMKNDTWKLVELPKEKR